MAALSAGDVDGFVGMLAADVVATGDAGDLRPHWPRPIAGVEKVTRLLAALGEQLACAPGVRVERVEVNGQPGALTHDADGALINVLAFDVVDGRIQAIRSVSPHHHMRFGLGLARESGSRGRRAAQGRDPLRRRRYRGGRDGSSGLVVHPRRQTGVRLVRGG